LSHVRLPARGPDRRQALKAGAFRAPAARGFGLDRLSPARQGACKRSWLEFHTGLAADPPLMKLVAVERFGHSPSAVGPKVGLSYGVLEPVIEFDLRDLEHPHWSQGAAMPWEHVC
jgi:hypothetical protein